MRIRNAGLLLLGLLALVLFAPLGALSQSEPSYGGRPPQFTPAPIPAEFVPSTPGPGLPVAAPGTYAGKGNPEFSPVSMFGMNLYLTGLERNMTEVQTLGIMADQAGVRWSREELSWANIEPQTKGSFNWAPYDARLTHDTNHGIDVVGMLLTTPRWASTNPNAPDWYWYEPANVNDYFDFVRAAVARWRNQVHVWEIWNEPNHQGTWNCINNCNRAAHYAQLLQGAYAAVKSVDPTARVLIGGLYVHDYNNEGMAFLDQVVAASGGGINFDGLSIHTYMPDRVPESMRTDSVVQNFQYRLNMANDWINAHVGRPGEIWVTEDGRSTCGSCPSQFRWSEDDQASMLTRMYGIAAAMPRVVQFDYFQFEDKFNNPNDMYGGMSIVRDNYATKPAYNAYRVAAQQLDGATYTGMGPQMIRGNNPQQPDSSDYIGFDYRFVRGSNNIHLVWRTSGTVTVNYPVESAVVDVVDRDGGTTRLTANNGTIPLNISPRPQYIVSVPCASRFSDVCPDHWSYPYVECLVSRNILTGYSDGTFRPNNAVTRGQLSKIVANAAGFTEPVSGQLFQDIPPGSTFYDFVQRLASRGIVGGYACGGPGEPCGPGNRPYFRPNANSTRGQISKIVSEARAFTDPPSGQSFQDVPPGSTFYTWVQRLSMHGIMSGYACGGPGEPCGPGNLPYFRPGNNATRAQTSKIVSNTWFPGCGPAEPQEPAQSK
jgi:hypothetical protein